jgi:hypothetical protein
MASSSDRPDKSPAERGAPSFVDKLVTDPKKPPQTLLLAGFTGASSEEDHTRLYFDAQLADYVEIPDAAILHKQAMPVEQSPLGASYLWVQRDAELVHGPVDGARRKAKFLEGRLQQDFAGASPRIPPETAPIICADPTEFPRCHPTTPAAGCQHPTVPGVNCPHPTTPAAGCPQPTTPGVNCPQPTVPGINCPPVTRQVVACHPTIALPACGHSHIVVCPPITVIPAKCPTLFLHLCPTQLPVQCPPHTVLPVQCPTHFIELCPTQSPVQCPPQTLFGPCGFTHLEHQCLHPTRAPALCPTQSPVLCSPVTGTIGCAPSLAGCPSGIACNPQTIPGDPGQGGFGGFPGFGGFGGFGG